MARFRADEGGERADLFLAAKLGGRGRKALAAAFDEGRVRVNGKRARKGQRLAAGDEVELVGEVAPAGGEAPVPEPEAPLELVHEDARLVVVAKPAGWPTHPLRPGETGTLAGAVVARYPECAGAAESPREGGAAHRLDAGTTGLVVFARDRECWRTLRAAFAAGRVGKQYLALVHGTVSRAGEIDLAIAHDRGGGGARVRVCVDADEASRFGGLGALTRFIPERRFRAHTLLRCDAVTGRMHQIRAHLAHLGTPVVGDALYGLAATADTPPMLGHFLHAERMTIPHPDGTMLEVRAPLPPDRQAYLEALTEG